jgi:HEAT repeat protein
MSEELQHLIEELHSPNKQMRLDAIHRLGKLGNAAVEPLIAQLESEDYEIRASAAWTLGKIKDPRAIEPLIYALQHTSDPERATVQALGQMGAPAVEPLMKILDHPDPEIRSRAIVALGLTNDRRAVSPLIYRLAYDEDQYEVANDALLMLMHLRKIAVKPLVTALQKGDDRIRGSADLALSNIRDRKTVEPLIMALNDPVAEVRYGVISALQDIGDVRALPELERIAREDNDKTRWGESLADVAKCAIEAIGSG